MTGKSGHLQVIDLPSIVDSCKEKWLNISIAQVNESVVRLGVIEGEFHWHQHENEDEFFYVVEGRLFIDLEKETIELGPKQGFTVPKAILHRTRAPKRTVILMVEKNTVKPQGD